MDKIKLPLFWQISIAIIFAVIFGLYLPTKIEYVSWIGIIFISALKMISIPLIFTTIISGIANIGNTQNFGRIAVKTLTYFILTSSIAILIGLFLVNLIKPGIYTNLNFAYNLNEITSTNQSFKDIIIGIIPENIFVALTSGNNILSIIFFAFLFGFFINKVNDKSKSIMLNFFTSVSEVLMKIVEFIIKFAPYGIFGIVAKVIAEQNDIVQTFVDLSKYLVTILLGLIIHSFFVLPLILKFIGKVNPYLHIKAVSSALITAFSTASTVTTISLTLNCVQNKIGVSNKISGFVIPIGTNLNMDGTALYYCVATIFIAQAYGIDLSITEQIIIIVTSLLASVGASSIPMSGIIMLSLILTSIGLPIEGIGLILVVDSILDMFKTTVNVFSNTCAAVIIAKSEGEILKI